MTKAFKALVGHKIIFASVLALTIFGAVYGFAATLVFNTNTLSAGNAIVGSCDTAGAAIAKYTTAYDGTMSPAGYKVATVQLTGLDLACNGKTISVTLTGTGTGLPATPTSGTVAAGAATFTPTSSVAASGVTGVSVALNG